MSTMIIKANMSITNPTYGKLPDLHSNLIFELDAHDLIGEYEEGETVTSWESLKGEASKGTRTFDRTLSNFNYPEFVDRDGVPAVHFDGNALLYNSGGTEYETNTYFLVAKNIGELGEFNLYNRIFTGVTPNYQGVLVDSGNLVPAVSGTGPGGNLGNPVLNPNTLFVLAMVFEDGELRQFQYGQEEVVYLNTRHGGSQSKTISLGSAVREGDINGTAFNGDISHLSMFNRPFSDDEIMLKVQELAEKYGLAE